MHGEVLVAILKNRADMEIVREQHWYRIPVEQVKKLKQRNCWTPRWLAFYQPKVFGNEAHAVNYYASVRGIREVSRKELFPDESEQAKSQKRYYKLELSTLKKLPQPIPSKRLRRITFIPTTWKKFKNAQEINDLWNESPLEDKLWTEFKDLGIEAERQEFVKVKEKAYLLDFAIYCMNGKIDIETDGDTWHSDKTRIPEDNQRDNDLETNGWRTLRFNTYHIKEQMTEYCLPTIVENINRLGGLKEGSLILRSISQNPGDSGQQLNLFDQAKLDV